MWSDTIRLCTAMLCYTLVELYAIKKGKNGALSRIIIVAIAVTAGIAVSQLLKVR